MTRRSDVHSPLPASKAPAHERSTRWHSRRMPFKAAEPATRGQKRFGRIDHRAPRRRTNDQGSGGLPGSDQTQKRMEHTPVRA